MKVIDIPAAKVALRLAKSAAVIALGVCIGAFVMQRSLIYHPQAEAVALPLADLYPGLEDVGLTASDGVELCGWYWPAPDARFTVLFLHGNAGDRSNRLGLLRQLHERGLGVFALDYRGYGGSDGSPSEDGLYLDAEAAVDWLRAHTKTELVYFGESLGTGVTVELARRQPPAAVILQAPFDSLVQVGRHHFPFLPVQLILRDRFDSASKIGEVEAPLLVLHGVEDKIVPYERGEALFAAARGPKKWFSVPKTGHNDLRAVLGDRFYEEITEFLEALPTGAPGRP